MGNYSLKEALAELTNADIDAVRSVYTYRCLSFEQLRNLHYKRNAMNKRVMGVKKAQEKVARLVEFGMLREIIHPYQKENRSVYQIESFGIELIRYFDNLPVNILDENKRVVRRGYYRRKELEIQDKNINHQVQLNEFVLTVLEALQEKQLPYRYQDEKRLDEFSSMRPDGVLELLDTKFFIEMDMGTESAKQLEQKWRRYQAYLHQNPLIVREKRLVVLFVCENVKNPDNRKLMVEKTIVETIGETLKEEFDIYVGSKEDLTQRLLEVFVPQLQLVYTPYFDWGKRLQEQGYTTYDGALVSHLFNSQIKHLFYCQKEQSDGSIQVIGSRVQDFFIDDFTSHALSVHHRLDYMNTYDFDYRSKFNRPLQYIVIVNDEEEFIRLLKPYGFHHLENVFFTTPARLLQHPLEEALFVCTPNNEIYHFQSMELAERVYEQEIILNTEKK